MATIDYVIRRTVITFLLIFFIATGLFFFFRLMPGDYATMLIGAGATQEQAEALRTEWGLNDPLYVQYWRYLYNTATLNLGMSHQSQQPVWAWVKPHLLNSVILIAPAIVLSYILGSIYGGIMGIKQDSRFEKYGIIPPTILGATPDFFIAMIFIFILATQLNLLPSQGIISVSTYQELGREPTNLDIYRTADFWHHYILPFTVITLKFLYFPALIMRSSIVETSGQDFAFFHRAKGLSRQTQFRHLLRHASLPVITLFPASMARALSGLVLIEIVFNWPGIGSLLVESVAARDTPVVQFMFLLIAIFIVVGNFLVDILYTVIDPRIVIGGEKE